jgi:hypothetical protein
LALSVQKQEVKDRREKTLQHPEEARQ